MLISEKQQEANRQNAQQPTGPKTPEGKAAVRLNALTYGLRARNLILPNEDSEEYKQLWADLEAEWPLGGGHLFQMHPFGAVLGCSRGLPKARVASISTKCQSRNSSPYSTAFPRNVPAWSAPSRAPCGN
jgi:hypothetical protein